MMAYRRSITARVKLLYQQQHRITPLFLQAHRHDSDGEGFPAKSVSRNIEIGSCIQNRFLGSKSNLSNFQRSSNFVGFGLVFGRSFSRSSVGEGVADGIEFRSDAVEAAAAKATPVVSGTSVLHENESELMAYRRSITARVKLFYQQQHRTTPLFSHAQRHDSAGEGFPAKYVTRNIGIRSCIPNHFLGNRNNFQRSSNFVVNGLVFCRSFSSSSVREGVPDGIEFYSDAMEVAAEKVTPAVSEVAAAAADSAFPVAAVQYLIDNVHWYTGFDWWASIVVATILVRCFQIPFYLSSKRCQNMEYLYFSKRIIAPAIMKEASYLLKSSMKGDDHDRAEKLVKEVGYPILTSWLLSGAIYSTFFIALSNMADKVPSFKEGGILWFTDLTTPDYMLLFPGLMASTLCYKWLANEDGNPVKYPTPIRDMGKQNWLFTLQSIPVLVFCPKAMFSALAFTIWIISLIVQAMFCHWITSRLFFMAFASVVAKPEVQKLLGLPTVGPSPSKNTKV